MINLEYQKGGSNLVEIILKCNDNKSFMMFLKKRIVDKHNSIMKKFHNNKYKNINRYNLYEIYIDLLILNSGSDLNSNSQSDLKRIEEKVIIKNELPDWYNKANPYSKINYLERKIFGTNVIPQVGEIESIFNIGIDKPMGYVQTFILTPKVMQKYKSDEFLFLEEIKDNWNGSGISNLNKINWREFVNINKDNKTIYNIYIIHLPSCQRFMDLNPNIVQDIHTYGYLTLFDFIIFFIINKLGGTDLKRDLVEALFGKKGIIGIVYPN